MFYVSIQPALFYKPPLFESNIGFISTALKISAVKLALFYVLKFSLTVCIDKQHFT